MLINLLQGTYKPNPWYFPHNFDIAAMEEKNIYIQNVVHFMSCHVMPLLASGRHNWGAGVVIICTIPCILFYSWDCGNYIFPKVTKIGSIFGNS